MAGECCWFDICPLCEGKGKLETKIKSKYSNKVSIQPPTDCECCNGTGKIVILKKLRRKNNES